MKLRCLPSCLAMIAILVGGGYLLGPNSALAEVRLPAVFSPHMVLQREVEIPVWGWAAPGEKVTVSLADQTATATAKDDGRWMVNLPKLPAGGPHELKVAGSTTLTVADVLVGEVWLASGQSNMAMTVNRVINAGEEMKAAEFPQIRMFTVARTPQPQPQADCTGAWTVCSPETVARFSATAYFFARDLNRELKVPVGILNSSVGGTAIEAWTSWEAQGDQAELKEAIFAPWQEAAATYNAEKAQQNYETALAAWKERAAKAKAAGKRPTVAPRKPIEPKFDPNHPATLFNGMINPLIPYAIRGAIWYQGERNSRSPEVAHLYRVQLPLLMEDWRSRWGQGDFPFAWVQLPNFGRSSEGWPIVREGMLLSLKVPHTGMAITTDIGELDDIHPRNKQDVGHRLALWALGDVYGQKVPATSGPIPAGHQVQGSKVVVSFEHADGLRAKDQDLRGFTIAGQDGKFVPAQAVVEGEKVIVSSKDVPAPQAVRYSWASAPDGNLINGAGLPASPFRTDIPK